MEEPAWSDTPSHVNHLTASSFLTFVKSKDFTLVMFYAPWCGHCKKAKPEFEKAADELKDVENKALAAVDCTKHMGMLCYKTINVFYILRLIFFCYRNLQERRRAGISDIQAFRARSELIHHIQR